MKIAIPVDTDGNVDHRWGKAHYVAIAETDASGKLSDFTTHAVRWDELHDEGGHGQHHARIIRFLREQEADAVMVNHMGNGIAHSIDRLGLIILAGAAGDARSLAQVAAGAIAEEMERREAAGTACGCGAEDLEFEDGCGCGGGGCGCGGHAHEGDAAQSAEGGCGCGGSCGCGGHGKPEENPALPENPDSLPLVP